MIVDNDERIGNLIEYAFRALVRARDAREAGKSGSRVAWWLSRAAQYRQAAYGLVYPARLDERFGL